MAAQEQFEAEQTAAREKKMSEADKASRLLAMEKAIEAAQRDEQKEFLRKVRAARTQRIKRGAPFPAPHGRSPFARAPLCTRVSA